MAAASLINFLSLLNFWMKHLPPRLPKPNSDTDGIYQHFYFTMQKLKMLDEGFPGSIPKTTGISTIRLRTPEDQVLVVQRPLPQPPRPPRDGARAEASPEVLARPAPQPYPNKRKDYLPVRLD